MSQSMASMRATSCPLCGHAVKVDDVRGAHQLRSDLLGARRERAAGARKSAAANCILISRMSWK
jgi:hypothetical protein